MARSTTPSFTRRDFQFIADTLRSTKPEDSDVYYSEQWAKTVRQFAKDLRCTNGQFQESRFLSACGLEE